MNASETPNASASASSRRLWLRHRGGQMAASTTAAIDTRRKVVPAGPTSSKICLASDAPNWVEATPPRTNSGAGMASITRPSLTAGKLPTVRRVPILRPALIAVLALLVTAGHAWARPNVVLVMTDDQTQESIKVMTKTRAGIGRAGTTFTNSVATFPLCCPSRATYMSGQYAHNHGVVNNVPPFGGYTRFNFANSLPVWLQRAGYRTMHVGRTLNGYGVDNPSVTDVPPGWNDWIATLDPTTYDYARWQVNQNGQVLALPGPDNPFEHQTDYLGRRASELVEQAGAPEQPFFLSLTFPAPHSGRPLDPDDPPGVATPSPAARHRDAFAALPLPRPPNFNERDVSDKPAVIRRRLRLNPAEAAAVQENYRQELESLLSVDDAVGAAAGHPPAHGQAGQHDRDLHLRQRLHPRRAPHPGGQGLPVRAVDPGAAADARAGRARGAALRPAGGQHRPGAHHPGCRRRASRGGSRTAARC